LHADLDYGASLFMASVRLPVSGVLSIEPEFGVWWHSETQRVGPRPQMGTDVTVRDRRTSWNLGANLLATARSGRSRPFAGAGAGIYRERTSQLLDIEDLDRDDTFLSERTNGPPLGVQGMAGVDVPLTHRVDVFGMFRVEMRSLRDPGGGLGLQGLARRAHRAAMTGWLACPTLAAGVDSLRVTREGAPACQP
jgi:hypothetical protein